MTTAGSGSRSTPETAGSPSWRRCPERLASVPGIRPGDLLVEVDGISAAGWTMERAVQALRGPIGTTIDLAVRREGVEAPLRQRLTRERIHQRAVSEGLLLAGGVGYLSLSMVRENCAAELNQEIARTGL